MKRKSQSYLPGFEGLKSNSHHSSTHGGTHAKGKRKTKRPVALKKPMHIVMRSDLAKGTWSLRSYKNLPNVNKLIQRLAKHHNIRIYRFAVVGNHVHIVLRAYQRKDFQNYLRSLAGNIACLVTGAKKGLRIEGRGGKGRKFWLALAFSRIVEWGNAFDIVKKYTEQNDLEAKGIIPYQPRKRKRVSTA